MEDHTLLRALVTYLLRGALVMVPVALTLYILYWIIGTVDRLLPVGVPGLGLLLTLGLVGLVGFLSSNVLGRALVDAMERFLRRVPLVKLVYSSIRDLVDAFVGDKRRFDRPVLVRLTPDGSLRLVGFVTRDGLAVLGLPGHVAVYLPQAYNFAGNLVLVPRQQVDPLMVPSGELMSFVISAGVSGLGAAPPAPAGCLAPAANREPA
ncbi:MAG: DUF502 domain-containing protein [Myxococcales bacterium]|nr:DUF502 domain-containing protein [Myxococcota bacterium]MDW8283583.1 DUF502 domain-containing protein [Myxococcales bacterium]